MSTASRRTATPSAISWATSGSAPAPERVAVDARTGEVLEHAARALLARLREGAGPRLQQRGAVAGDRAHHGVGGGEVLADAPRVRASRRPTSNVIPAAPKSSVVALSP